MTPPAPIRCGSRRLSFGERAYVMGVLNVTPDSFSDGGRFARPQAAIDRALEMAQQGADIIDVGGESSRPGADPVTADEELARVLPVLEALEKTSPVPLSIDTTKAVVAQAALEAGACMVNDITALNGDPQMGAVVARAGVPVVLMHMRGNPRTMQQGPLLYQDVLGEIGVFLEEAMRRAEGYGIVREKILLDPGIGFGKSVEHNLEILNGLEKLRALGRPLLIGPSRKAFIGKVLDRPVGDRVFGTAAAVAAAVIHGADVVRVHDVTEMRQVVDLASSIRSQRAPAAAEGG